MACFMTVCVQEEPVGQQLLCPACVLRTEAVQPTSSDAALAAASVHFRRWTAQGHIPGSCRVTCSLVEAGQGKQFCSPSLLYRWCLMQKTVPPNTDATWSMHINTLCLRYRTQRTHTEP